VLSDIGSWGSRLFNDTGWRSLFFDSGGRGILLLNDWGKRSLFDNGSGLRFFNTGGEGCLFLGRRYSHFLQRCKHLRLHPVCNLSSLLNGCKLLLIL
jgi:hypothetical protein